MSNTALGKSISQIHKNLLKSLKYITNPIKTNNSLMVSGLGCSTDPELACRDFKNIALKFNKNTNKNINNVLAHHYLISFNPNDKLTIEKSHELALEVAERFLGKEYKAIIATHDDKAQHIHTHLIFNSTRNTGKKYESTPHDLQRFKDIITDVCLENNITPIVEKKEKDKKKNLTYKQWMDKNNICSDEKIERFKYIEQIVKEILKNKKVKTLDDFESEINKYKIEIKYKNKQGKLYKNITYRAEEWERGFRGKFSLSLENVIARINNINHEECLTPYKKWCYKTHEKSYAKFIKESIDIAVTESNSIDDLEETLKNKYGIKMQYLSKFDKPLKRIKFLILNSGQKNKIGSASLDEENREAYEYLGLKSRCEQFQEVKVEGDLFNSLKNIQKYLIDNNQKDKWRIDEGIEIVLRRNLRSRYDINNQIKILEKKSELNSSRINLINHDIEEMEILYSQIYDLTQKYNELTEKLKKMKGFNALLNKKNIENKLKDYNNEINNLKESQYYSKEKKYSERIHELTDEKYELIEENRCNDTEIEILNQVEYIDKNKETIINYKQEENEINDSLMNENRDI